MIRPIISIVLLIISVVLNFKHGWDTLTYKKHPGTLKMLSELGITEAMVPFLGILTFLNAVLLLFPKTFFWGNVSNAFSIVLIMALALRAGSTKIAVIEIPFLILPLLMIWLKYPFKS